MILTLPNDTTIHVSVPNAGISTTQRFELGSYIEIDSEIMRVTSSTLSGSGNNEITVIRGALGTLKENHSGGALIKRFYQEQFSSIDLLILGHQVIHLNILDMVQVTIQLVYHRFRLRHYQERRSSYHKHKKLLLVLLFIQV